MQGYWTARVCVRLLLITMVSGLFGRPAAVHMQPREPGDDRTARLTTAMTEALSISEDGTVLLDQSVLAAHDVSSEDTMVAERFVADINDRQIDVVMGTDVENAFSLVAPAGLAQPAAEAGVDGMSVWVLLDPWWLDLIRTNPRAVEIVSSLVAALLSALISARPELPLALKVSVTLFITNIVIFVRYLIRLLVQQDKVQSARISIPISIEPAVTLYADALGKRALVTCRQISGCAPAPQVYAPFALR